MQMNQGNSDSKKPEQENKSALAQSIGTKQFRFSDWFAGKLIKGVSFFSIAFVVLIFLFVFRETLPLFSHTKKTEKTGAITDQHGKLAPESYFAGDSDQTGGELKPETYSPDEDNQVQDELKPEVYSPDEENQDADEMKPETYSPDGDSPDKSELRPEVYSSGQETANTGELRPETYGDVVPEDHFSDEPAKLNRTAEEEDAMGKPAENPLKTLFSKDWQPVSDNPRYGLLPLFVGTLKVTLLAILFAAPLAIMAALYTAMFAPPRLKEVIKPIVELLAGFPSVVIGFFALTVLASFFQNIFGYTSRLNAFVGAIAMGLAAIPIIYTLTEDALTAVPRTYTEASLGLGASIRQTAFSVILPAATPGIFAAVILGIGRVFGETMIALMATGNAALISVSPFDSVRTLSATIGAEMAEVVFGDTHYSVLFLIGSLLFIFTFSLNAVAEFYFKNRVVRRIQGK
jgi:phosphate transport system permease protein